MKACYKALGIMTGTSLDGVDIALIETDGLDQVYYIAGRTFPYDIQLRAGVSSLTDMISKGLTIDYLEMLKLEQCFSHFCADKALELLRECDDDQDLDVIGCHGQTVIHKPELGLTSQMLNGHIVASRCNADLVCDFRRQHMVMGGQGAPLTPIYHKVITQHLKKPLAVINIGGVSNITWIGTKGELIFFDCGPGVTLIDEWVVKKTGGKHCYDEDGKYAKKGAIINHLVDKVLESDYFKSPPPKTLDKRFFDSTVQPLIEGCSLEDGCATLCYLSAKAIIDAFRHLPQQPEQWLLTGGGSHNPCLTSMLKDMGCKHIIENSSSPLFDSAAMEACAFAYMATRVTLGLAIAYEDNFANGAIREPTIKGGVIIRNPENPTAAVRALMQKNLALNTSES